MCTEECALKDVFKRLANYACPVILQNHATHPAPHRTVRTVEIDMSREKVPSFKKWLER
jgi:hypothetical protein